MTITSVDTTRSFAAGGYFARGGKSNYTANDLPGVGWFTLDLISATNLQITRGVTGSATADVGWFVVQFLTPSLTQIHYRWRNDDGSEGGFDTGTVADGSATISTSKNINTAVIGTNRSTNADGILTNATANPIGTSITVTSTTGFAAGDEILLINMQGASGDTADVGNYEFLKVASVPNSTTLNLTSSVQKSYDGTTFSNQKVAVQRVPQWTNVTISSGGTLTANDWAGSSGGIIVFRATGTVDVQSGGTISANALGYRGGSGGTGNQGGTNGEWADGYIGSGGTVGNLGSGGGGTGQDYSPESASSAGTRGGGGGGGVGGASGQTNNDGGGGGGGGTYGEATLANQIFLGGGGGGGGGNASSGATGSNGVDGGGIIIIIASTITVNSTGNITANGVDATVGNADSGGSGAGAGGSIKLITNTATLDTNRVTATGGSSANGAANGGGGGGGGLGRIRIEADTKTGTTTPTYSGASTPGGTGATWAANEDTKLSAAIPGKIYRLRFEVSNEGTGGSGAVTYKLQVPRRTPVGQGHMPTCQRIAAAILR